MLVNLPSDFLAALKSPTRRPIQLAKFHLNNTIYGLSDIDITVAGTHYLPWVEEWGVLSDAASMNNLFGSEALEIRTCNITLIISPPTKPFINLFLTEGIENTKVELFQWFEGMTSPPVLIDVFVCQDPITINEGSMLFSLDLVSPLMADNNRLHPVGVGEEHYPVVVGTVSHLPLIDMGTGVSARLAGDITHNRTGYIKLDDVSEFPSSGYFWVDEEQLRYSGKSGTSLNVIQRGLGGLARPHQSGGLAVLNGTSFKYAVAAGPVTSISGINYDGSSISGGVVDINSNPATVTFNQWPPTVGVETGRPEVVNSISTSVNETKMAHFVSTFTNASHFYLGVLWNVPGNSRIGQYLYRILPTTTIASGRPYNVTAKIKYRVDTLPAGTKVRLTFGYANAVYPSVSDIVGVQTIEITEVSAVITDCSVSLGSLSWAELARSGSNWSFTVLAEVIGAGTCTLIIYEPRFELSYSVQSTALVYPAERLRMDVAGVTCTVEGKFGAGTTPPSLVQGIIEDHTTCGVYVDTSDFAAEHTRYTNAGYILNGLLPAGVRVHEAIKRALYEGLGRLKYNAGKIQFLSYFDDDNATLDRAIDEDNVLLRSKEIEHYSSEDISNNITVKFNYDQAKNEYLSSQNKFSQLSIDRFGVQDSVRELSLISATSVADQHAERMLRFLEEPPAVFRVSVFMPEGYELEKGDLITVKDFTDPAVRIKGNLLSMDRVFGQGKTGRINTYILTVAHFTILKVLELSDILALDDSFINLPRILHVADGLELMDSMFEQYRNATLVLTDRVCFGDSFHYIKNTAYDVDLVDAIAFKDDTIYFGTHKTLTLPVETLALSGNMVPSTCHGYGDCGYGVKEYGD